MAIGVAELAHTLNSNYAWGGFALGSLEPPHSELCEWRQRAGTLLLVYRGLTPELVCPYGGADGWEQLIADHPGQRIWANVPDALRPAFERYYQPAVETRMRRMVLQGLVPAAGNAERLGPEHQTEIEALLHHGDWVLFVPAALAYGHYYCVREHGQLVAVAGTHVASVRFNTAALGTVYTHPAWRGRGLARVCSSHVLASVGRAGIGRVVLNVEESKAGARRIYERLGFQTACVYLDAECTRVESACGSLLDTSHASSKTGFPRQTPQTPIPPRP